MRVRTIMTVALLSAGCGTSGSTRSAPDTRATGSATTAETTAKPAPPATTTVTAVPAPIAAAAAPAAPRVATAEQLDVLRDEISGTDREQTIARMEHFRPLCDAEGYPLVGNLVTKTSRGGAPVATFCAEVRARSGAR